MHCTPKFSVEIVGDGHRKASKQTSKPIEWVNSFALSVLLPSVVPLFFRRHHDQTDAHKMFHCCTHQNARLFILSGPKNVLFGILCLQAILYVAWEFRNHRIFFRFLSLSLCLSLRFFLCTHSIRNEISSSKSECQCVWEWNELWQGGKRWRNVKKKINDRVHDSRIKIALLAVAIAAKVNVVMMMCRFIDV